MKENYGYCIGIDMAGFSKKSVNRQLQCVKSLNALLKKIVPKKQIVNTGDGAFIVFPAGRHNIREVIDAGLKITRMWDREKNKVGLRMGIGAGVIIPHPDAQGKSNFIGDGINLTARIMDCGNEGHILLSQLVALEIERKSANIPDGYSIAYMGEYVVKHSLVLDIYGLVPENMKTAVPNRTIPVKNKVEWERVSDKASNIVFPKMETLTKLSTLPPESSRNFLQGKDCDFIVANAQIHLQRDGHRVIAHVHIDDYPFVATDRETRLLLESGEISGRHGKTVLLEGFKRGRLNSVSFNGRFSAGGAIGMIKCKNGCFIFLTLRDEDAPNYPNSLGPASGLSETITEWTNPRLTVYREFAEEVLITVKRSGKRYIIKPYVGNLDDDSNILNDEFEETKKRFQKKYDGKLNDTFEASAKRISLGRDSLFINWGMRKGYVPDCNLVIDSERGVIDIIEAIKVDLPEYSSDEIIIYDMERRSGPDIVTERDVLLFTIEEFCKLSIPGEQAKYIQRWKGGKEKGRGKRRILPKTPKMNPPLLESVIPLVRALKECKSEEAVAETISQMRYVHNDQRSFVSLE